MLNALALSDPEDHSAGAQITEGAVEKYNPRQFIKIYLLHAVSQTFMRNAPRISSLLPLTQDEIAKDLDGYQAVSIQLCHEYFNDPKYQPRLERIKSWVKGTTITSDSICGHVIFKRDISGILPGDADTLLAVVVRPYQRWAALRREQVLRQPNRAKYADLANKNPMLMFVISAHPRLAAVIQALALIDQNAQHRLSLSQKKANELRALLIRMSNSELQSYAVSELLEFADRPESFAYTAAALRNQGWSTEVGLGFPVNAYFLADLMSVYDVAFQDFFSSVEPHRINETLAACRTKMRASSSLLYFCLSDFRFQSIFKSQRTLRACLSCWQQKQSSTELINY